MPDKTLEDILKAMAVFDPGIDYYAITMTVDEQQRLVIGTQTEWVGRADKSRLTEVRKPSIVKPEAMIRFWNQVNQSYVVVNDEPEWFVYYLIGGNALVRNRVAETYLPDWLSDHGESTRLAGSESPFVDLSLLPRQSVQRAPTPKLRMEVFKRDQRRCRICGSSPAKDVHVELHIHHIRPWERGGHTNIENLITLCHTCHRGLDPHEDQSLFDLLPMLEPSDEHALGVQRYREKIQARIAAFERPAKRIPNRSTRRRPA
jgi:hypothetical protein